MNFLKKLFKKKDIDDVLDPKTTVYVRGIWFTIRKINPVDHMHGAKVLTESYQVKTIDSVRQKNKEAGAVNHGKIMDHYRDVFTSCVVDPVFVRKASDVGVGSTHVDRLFLDWAIADELYQKIMEFTYGKKKVKLALLQYRLQNPMF